MTGRHIVCWAYLGAGLLWGDAAISKQGSHIQAVDCQVLHGMKNGRAQMGSLGSTGPTHQEQARTVGRQVLDCGSTES